MKHTQRTALLRLTQAGLIAAMYAVCTALIQPAAYGPVQFRFSEVLTILPVFTPAAIPGLAVGCLVANLYGLSTGANIAGAWDLLFGGGVPDIRPAACPDPEMAGSGDTAAGHSQCGCRRTRTDAGLRRHALVSQHALCGCGTIGGLYGLWSSAVFGTGLVGRIPDPVSDISGPF